MAQAAIPILAGTGVQILGAKMGWDPRLTALAGIAAGGVGAGLTSGAFAGGTAAQAATGVASSVNPHAGMLSNAFTPSAAVAPVATGAVWNPTTVGQGITPPTSGIKYMTPPADLSYSAHAAGPHGMDMYASQSAPTWRTPAVDEVKAPFFDRTQKDGSQGLSPADSLGVSMLDTFLQYELALAQQPPPRIPSSGGGGGGGGGGASGPAFQGGGKSGPYQVVDFYGDGGTTSYEPQPI